ncbi:MAG: type II toxin-antitoxin system VapC family toxin [Thiohalocapsa sp.]|nr:type II toxin-antitoxin system VapC family toxin [Thiohalocapsa sp.]MCF7989540.1 type II toxin-antitoxin system VapC family toxin [Thiohalocapsa sp.]
MGLLLDTNVLIRAERLARSERGGLDFTPWAGRGHALISAVTASELLVGVHRANSEARRIRRSAFVEAVLAALPISDFTLEVARTHAEIVAALRKQGLSIGAHDAIIAATALAGGHAVLTTDVDDFGRVPGLEVLCFDRPSASQTP